MNKVCRYCHLEKDESEFSFRYKKRNIRHNKCKTCHKEQLKAAYDPEKKRARDLKTKYGLTEDCWSTMYEAQKGECKICGKFRQLVVDHSHKTGDVRALLCHRCNLAIGQFDDDPQLLRLAANYLETFIKEGL